ncbi:GNAT family N-acetyltransferase [Streptomyces xiamenensis]|uniref:GNAT family N-acetyltransferase n=1 Tax=Streptomyces xiamenensis TaxID=408015 RepID=UPI003D71EBE7
MPIDPPLLTAARAVWESLAGVPVTFRPAAQGPQVVLSPASGLCPPGWAGVVAVGGAVIATVPEEAWAAPVRDALAPLSAGAAVDPATVRRVLPVAELLGPAALAYLDAARFRPVGDGPPAVVPLPARHAAVEELERESGAQDADEADLGRITSPAFVVLDGETVVAAAGYRRWAGGAAHIGVLTRPGHRGRGLARATGSAAAAHALAAGLLPQWRARIPASRRVAAALGFAELGAQLSVRLRRPSR